MNTFITRYATWRNVLFLVLGLVLINILLVLSMGGNPNLKPLDLQFTYSPEKAYELIGAYSEAERFNYIVVELTLDVIYPIVYALFFSFLLFLLHKDLQIAKFPFIIVILDFIENGGIVMLLLNYPKEMYGVARFTSVFTTMKWITLGLTLVLILWGVSKKFKR